MRERDFSISNIVPAIISVLIIVKFIINSATTLASGGIWLYSEKESDAVFAEGIVTKVDKVGKYEVEIWIDGEMYIASEEGNFVEGDQVVIKYLPQSRFVLSQENVPSSEPS